MERTDWEKLIISNKPVECENCKGRMFYLHSGIYKCESCGNEVLDDFGKVKNFLEENGPTPAMVVEQATGVRGEVIEFFLKKGKVEIPEGSKYYLKCERCGCSLRFGKFCTFCVKEMTGDITNLFHEDIGEIPKYELNPNRSGKMHFLDRKKRKDITGRYYG